MVENHNTNNTIKQGDSNGMYGRNNTAGYATFLLAQIEKNDDGRYAIFCNLRS